MKWNRGNKYNARASPAGVPGYISELNGPLSTASQAEATFYADLDNLWRAGEIKWWLAQVSFTVGTTDDKLKRVTYRSDALVCRANGEMVVLDRKGFDTPASRAKRAAVRDRYKIRVEIVTRHARNSLEGG